MKNSRGPIALMRRKEMPLGDSEPEGVEEALAHVSHIETEPKTKFLSDDVRKGTS